LDQGKEDHRPLAIWRQAGTDLPAFPMARDLIASPADKELFDVATAPVRILRPFFLGPGVPADRVRRHAQGVSDLLCRSGLCREAGPNRTPRSHPISGQGSLPEKNVSAPPIGLIVGGPAAVKVRIG